MQSRHLTNRSRNTTGAVSHNVLDWEGKTSELPQYGQLLRPILRTFVLYSIVYAVGRKHKFNTTVRGDLPQCLSEYGWRWNIVPRFECCLSAVVNPSRVEKSNCYPEICL
jgi:hypothetical protein